MVPDKKIPSLRQIASSYGYVDGEGCSELYAIDQDGRLLVLIGETTPQPAWRICEYPYEAYREVPLMCESCGNVDAAPEHTLVSDVGPPCSAGCGFAMRRMTTSEEWDHQLALGKRAMAEQVALRIRNMLPLLLLFVLGSCTDKLPTAPAIEEHCVFPAPPENQVYWVDCDPETGRPRLPQVGNTIELVRNP